LKVGNELNKRGGVTIVQKRTKQRGNVGSILRRPKKIPVCLVPRIPEEERLLNKNENKFFLGYKWSSKKKNYMSTKVLV